MITLLFSCGIFSDRETDIIRRISCIVAHGDRAVRSLDHLRNDLRFGDAVDACGSAIHEIHMERIGIRALNALLPNLDSDSFSADFFCTAGVCVVRNAIPRETIASWQAAWNDFYSVDLSGGRKVNRFNPVAVDEQPPSPLAEMHQHPALLDVVEQAFGPDIALYNQRFVIKDRHSRGPVFLHQDFPYHLGWPNKASVFVPLSTMNPENGGMVFYPGTH